MTSQFIRTTRLATVLGTLLLGVVSLPAAQGPFGGGGRGGPQGGGPGPARGGRGAPPRDASAAPAVGTGSISGAVMSPAGTPIRRARVTLTGPELRGGRSIVADDQGRFTFQALPAGSFMLSASKPGFLSSTYGAKRPGRAGTAIKLADGQQLEKADLTLPRGSVITGIVVDENGDPSAGTQVRALRYIIRTGERTLQQAGVDSTDDRGMYRIYDLQPGEYIVNAVPRNLNLGDARVVIANQLQVLMQQAQARGGGAAGGGGLGALSAEFVGVANAQPAQDVVARVELLQQQLAAAEQEQAVAYAPVYYPGTTSAGAAGTVTLNAGEERSGVDFQLQLVPTSRVDGSVVGPDGAPQPNVQVGLVPAAQAGVPSVPGGLNITRVGPDGRFSFRAVTPGQYTVQARLAIRGNAGAPDVSGRGGRGGPLPAGRGGQVTEVLWASLDLSVNGQDTPNVALTLQPGMTVSGRVEIDDAMAGGNVDFSRVRLALTPRGSDGFEIGGAVPPATVDPSGRFTIVGVSPGRYTLTGGVAGGGQMQRGGNPGPLAAGGPANLTVKSAMANGRDLLDFPIEIGPNDDLSNVVVSFSSKVQELSGTIQNTAGQPVSDYTIIVFPSDSRYWQPMARRIAASRPGTDGRFVFRGLPPGEYRITAVTDAEPGEWYDPAFLNQVVPASIPISLREGETRVQDIRLAGN